MTRDLLVHGCVLIMFIVLSAGFLSGRGGFLIAGYNTMPKEERDRFDEKALCRFMGFFMIVLGVSYAFIVLSIYFLPRLFLTISIIVFVLVCFAGVIYANTGNRFTKNNISK